MNTLIIRELMKKRLRSFEPRNKNVKIGNKSSIQNQNKLWQKNKVQPSISVIVIQFNNIFLTNLLKASYLYTNLRIFFWLFNS